MTELEAWKDKYIAAKQAYEELSGRVTQAKTAMDSAERCLLAAMNTAGVKTFESDDGVTFARRDATKYSCLAANRGALLDQLERDGYRDMFTVNAASLSTLMKEMVSNSEDGELPEAYKPFINVFEDTKLSVRGLKKK